MKLENRNIVERILAGDGLLRYNDINRTGEECSAGFWARVANFSYIATAGHCFEKDVYFYLFPWNSSDFKKIRIGRMLSHYLDTMDFGLVYISNKNVSPVPSIRNTDSIQYKELLIKDHIVVSSNGAHLCISALKSHVKCGYVKALSGFAEAINEDGLFENIFVVSMHALEGDSGGPVFSYKQNLIHTSLNGIISSGYGYDINGDINNAIIEVMPIDFILNRTGINVVTAN
ncbi:hypothetical protein C2G38_2035100 [Gigaspora rosea]|uniref:Peptidase S1 domain-containing protein n=1 Tax=Gigaspora rosea TaxID=44941 RepID=A0A397VF34_9GLOM|nr:hypothetical protein C2G38_2035100 [Gigaspora rosea]